MKVKMLRSMSGNGISWRRGQIVDMRPKGSGQRLVAAGMAEPADGDVVADHIYATPKKAAEPSPAEKPATENETAPSAATGGDDSAGGRESGATGGDGNVGEQGPGTAEDDGETGDEAEGAAA